MLTNVKQYQYGTSVFLIPKKEGTVRFIMDYRKLKNKLVGNFYPLPRICETIQKLEGLQYVTRLYPIMGYYNIRI